MNSISKWTKNGLNEQIDFRVSLYVGGGLGDLAHRLYDMPYLRALRSIKEVFPQLHLTLLVDTSRSVETAKCLFEQNPYIDTIIVQPQIFINRDIYVSAVNLLGNKKNDIGKYLPEIDNETVFRRVINRVYELLSFPRLRTITMDDFFQQLKLDINDFQADEPKMYLSDRERAYGKETRAKVCPTGKKLIGIHLFTGDGKRMLNPTFARKMMNYLIEKGYYLIILGTAKESNPGLHEDSRMRDMVSFLKGFKGNPQVGYYCDDSGIRLKATLISNCDYFIGNDSGLMHIAWLHGTKTISLFREQTVMETERFDRVTGYYWAVAAKKPYASFIIYNAEGKFEITLIDRRIKELDDAERKG